MPPRSSNPTRHALHLGISAGAALSISLACGDDETGQQVRPPGPVDIVIEELRPRGADTWRPGDAEPVLVGCDRLLGVTVRLFDPTPGEGGAANDHGWLLRPPGACNGRAQCGPLSVSVESLSSGATATARAALESVIVDLAPLGTLDERVRIRAELLEDGQTPAMRDGELLADELEVELRSEDCPDGEGGTGGGAGTGSSGQGGVNTGGAPAGGEGGA